MNLCRCRQTCPNHPPNSRCNAVATGRDYCKACKSNSNRRHYRKTLLAATGEDFIVDQPPSEDTPLDEILATRSAEFARRHASQGARKAIPVEIGIDGPIGIALFGDLHLDDPGTNIDLVRAHTKLVMSTPGMFAATIGDIQNSWIGRLAHLWGVQHTTARDAWKLAEWWFGEILPKLLFAISGNHDYWALNTNKVDPLEWIMAGAKGHHDAHGARFELCLPSGDSYFVNARHDFRGRSQYNAAHGLVKAAIFGRYDDLLVAGHTHETGLGVLKNPDNGRSSHPLRLGSYKWYDDYAKQEGFMDGNVSECAVFMIDPYETDVRHRTWIELNPFRAAKVLKLLRKEYQNRQLSLSSQAKSSKLHQKR